MEYVHAAPDWVAANVWPAIDTKALRGPAAFAAALTPMVALPVPDAPPATITQLGSLLTAPHEHHAGVERLIEAVPPPFANVWLPGVIEYVHDEEFCES